MARAAAIDEGAWFGSPVVAAATATRAPTAPRLDATPLAASAIVSNPPSRLSLAIAVMASLIAHAAILAAVALYPGPAQPTGEPDAIAVEFVDADAGGAAVRPASPAATGEPSKDVDAATPPPLDKASPTAAPAVEPLAAATSLPTPAAKDALPPALAAKEEPVAVAPALALAAKDEPVAVAPPPEEASPPAAPAVEPPAAATSLPTPAAEDAPPPALAAKEEPVAVAPALALAAKEEPVAVAPAPLSDATPFSAAPAAPRSIATPAAPAAQPPPATPKPRSEAKPKPTPAARPPAAAPKPHASARPKLSPASTRAAARARPTPNGVAGAASAARQAVGSAPAHGRADVASYRDALVARINGAVRYPEAARERGATGVAMAHFALDAAGNVTAAELMRSSGDGALDAEAVAAVRRASPLPAPPADAPRAYDAPIRFELR